MENFLALLVFVSLVGGLSTAQVKFPPLTDPVANNAVAGLKSHGGWLLYSFMGVGPQKTWDAITNAANYADPTWDRWYPLHPVPGTAGRIAASAVGLHDRIYLLGGYVVDANHHGAVVPDVNLYEPDTEHWVRGNDLPIPIAASVVGVFRDRYIYVVGGLSTTSIVANVQVYDTDKNKWFQATPLPGTPVFGHAGALLDDTIVYVDGAYKNPSAAEPRFLASDQCWIGKIDRHDPAKITWSKLPSHPGAARYGIAAGASPKDHKIYFSGGSESPHDYTGKGFDGKPAEPLPMTFAFDLRSEKWEVVNENTPNPVMDSGGILAIGEGLVIAGGMEKGQQVTKRVTVLPMAAKAK